MDLFIPVEQALKHILETQSLCGEKELSLHDSLGFTLSRKVESKDEIPPFENSAMDGYAVRARDVSACPVRLHVIGEQPAGSITTLEVSERACIRIMTGALIPEGADAVVPVEWTEVETDSIVRIDRAPEIGQNIRPAGRDVKGGELVFEAGQLITPPVIGMLAALGYDSVWVRVPPLFAVIATGDELVEPGELLTPGKIRNSSGPALRAQVLDAGGRVLPLLLARDNLESIRNVLIGTKDADALIFAGGVSVGDYDLVKQVLDEAGMKMLFWKVKQRPGKPLAYGLLNNKPVFGLPGNPVSSAMCFEQYVRPAIAVMLGRQVIQRPRHPAVLLSDTPKVKGLHFLARGIAGFQEDGRLGVHDTGPQASNLYSSVVRANCIVHIKEELEQAPAGTPVEVEWLW